MHDVRAEAALRVATASSDTPLERAFRQWNSLLENLPIGVCVCDTQGVVIRYNRRAAELWGQEPQAGVARTGFCGLLRTYRADGRPLALDGTCGCDGLTVDEGAHGCEVVLERADGSRIDLLANVEPLRDEAGALVGAVSCFQDVSEIKRDRHKAERRDGWVLQVFEQSPVAIYWTDAGGRIMSFNRAAAELWGRRPVLGEDLWCGSHKLFHPDGQLMPVDTCPMALALKTGRAMQGAEAVFERPDGSGGAFLAYPTLLHDSAGKLVGAVNMLVDISDRKQAEDRQRVLVDELNHRVKNTLASVQSLAVHSLRGEEEPRLMRERFEARLVALSNAHNQLAERRWQAADLHELAQEILAPYGADHRVRLEGGPLMLPAKPAVTLCMALHELATNAVKYGALSTPQGHLALRWRVEDRWLHLEWQEAGGPPVAPPIRKGFGTRFIEGAVASELSGRIELRFEPAGVRCRIQAPL